LRVKGVFQASSRALHGCDSQPPPPLAMSKPSLALTVLTALPHLLFGDRPGYHPWDHQPYYPDYSAGTGYGNSLSSYPHLQGDSGGYNYHTGAYPTNNQTYAYSDTLYPPTSYQSQATGTGLASTTSDKVKRFFTTSDLSASLSLTFSLYIPLTDIASSIYVSTPFYWTFPTSRKRSSDQVTEEGTGRAFGLAGNSVDERKSLYTTLESYISRYTGSDGHACLLRAMCEVGSTPDHDDGLLGDLIDMVLTAGHAFQFEEDFDSESLDVEYREYMRAFEEGQENRDCSIFHKGCPMSFFNLVEELI